MNHLLPTIRLSLKWSSPNLMVQIRAYRGSMRGLLRGVRGSGGDEDPFRLAQFQGVDSYLVANHATKRADWGLDEAM